MGQKAIIAQFYDEENLKEYLISLGFKYAQKGTFIFNAEKYFGIPNCSLAAFNGKEFRFHCEDLIELTKIDEIGCDFCNKFGGEQVIFHVFDEDVRRYSHITYEKGGGIHVKDYFNDEFYTNFNIFYGQLNKYIIAENDNKYHKIDDDGVFHVDNKYYYYDFSKQDLELARFLHKWIFSKYSHNDFDEALVKNEEDIWFLQQAIGYYKPIWDEPDADDHYWEVDHLYKTCETFDSF